MYSDFMVTLNVPFLSSYGRLQVTVCLFFIISLANLVYVYAGQAGGIFLLSAALIFNF